MKKLFALSLSVVLSVMFTSAVYAAEFPEEAVPIGTSDEAVRITENIIGGILDEVYNGLGYGAASGRANTLIRQAVENDEANGYGYAELSAISQNSIRTIIDIMQRPNVYQTAETMLRPLLSEQIAAIKNGKDYSETVLEAYIVIYPEYFSASQMFVDQCYWETTTVDPAILATARKILHDAK